MKDLPLRFVLWVLIPAIGGSLLGWWTRDPTMGLEQDLPPTSAGQASVDEMEGTSVGISLSYGKLEGALAEQQRLCDRLRRASLEQMYQMMVESEGMADPHRRQAFRELIAEHMVRSDPSGAWDLLVAATGGLYTGDLLTAWARVDLAGAMRWAEGRGKDSDRLLGSLLVHLDPENSDGFAALLPRLKPGVIREDRMEEAFRLLGARDSARALEVLTVLSEGHTRNLAASAMAEGWARGNPEKAYVWAKALADPSERESALRGVFRAWAESDPQGVAARLDELAKDEQSVPLVQGESPVRAIVGAWATQNPKEAAAWLHARSGEGGDPFGNIFSSEILPLRESWDAAEIASLARRPGESEVTDRADQQFTRSLGWGSGRERYQIFGEFGGPGSPLGYTSSPHDFAVKFDNPAQAFDDLTRQPPDATRQHVLQEAATQWATQDPRAALEKLQSTEDTLLKLSLINALSNVARHALDLDLAMKVAAAFPPDSGGDRGTVDRVAAELARRDPEHAHALLAGDHNTAVKATLAAALAAEQATYDPAGAVAWAAGQSDETLQSAATRAAVANWAAADAYAVSEWLTTQPMGAQRETAIEALVQALQAAAPEDALSWAGSLTDEGKRVMEQERVLLNLAWNNPAHAIDLLERSSLPEPRRRTLRERIETQPRR